MGLNTSYTFAGPRSGYTKYFQTKEKQKTFVGKDYETGVEKTRVTAKNADADINPSEIRNAIDNLMEIFKTECDNLGDKVEELATDTEKSLVVQGTSLKGKVVNIAKYVREVPDTHTSQLELIYERAVAYHDKLQKQYNEKAKKAAKTDKDGNALHVVEV